MKLPNFFKRRFFLLSILISNVSLAPQTVGNGGDPLDATIARARAHAAHVVRVAEISFFREPGPMLQELVAKRSILADDILSSPYEWSTLPQEKCALTLPQPNAVVHLNRDRCLESEFNAEVVAELLIHESIHHLGIEDENLVPLFANAFMDASLRNPNINAFIRLPQTVFSSSRLQDLPLLTWMPYLLGDGSTKNISVMFTPDDKAGEVGALYWLDAAEGAPRWYRTQLNADGKALIAREQASFLSISYEDADRHPHDNVLVWGGITNRLGGYFDFQTAGAVIDPLTGEFAEIAQTHQPQGRIQHTGVAVGQKFFVWGGLVLDPPLDMFGARDEGTVTQDGAVYDIVHKRWDKLPISNTTPSARYGHISVVTDDGVVVWGGCQDAHTYLHRWKECSHELTDGALLNLSSLKWEPIPQIPYENRKYNSLGAVAAAYKNQAFIWSEGEGAIYNTTSKVWTKVPFVNDRRWFARAFWSGDTIVIAGGSQEEQSLLIYHTRSQTWEKKVYPEAFASRFTSVVYNGLETVFVARELFSLPHDMDSKHKISTTLINIHRPL